MICVVIHSRSATGIRSSSLRNVLLKGKTTNTTIRPSAISGVQGILRLPYHSAINGTMASDRTSDLLFSELTTTIPPAGTMKPKSSSLTVGVARPPK